MTIDSARRQIVLLSLITTTVFSCLLIISPLIIRLSGDEALQLVQSVFPVFAGYIGAAVIFLFRPGSNTASTSEASNPGLLRIFVYAPFIIFWTIDITILIYFYLSNLPGLGGGMTFPQISAYITLVMSFMNATTGALIAFLFQSEELQRQLGIQGASPTKGEKDD